MAWYWPLVQKYRTNTHLRTLVRSTTTSNDAGVRGGALRRPNLTRRRPKGPRTQIGRECERTLHNKPTAAGATKGRAARQRLKPHSNTGDRQKVIPATTGSDCYAARARKHQAWPSCHQPTTRPRLGVETCQARWVHQWNISKQEWGHAH